MVDPSKIDLDRIPQEVRLKILEYVRREKGVKPKRLEVTSGYLSKIRRGEKPVSDRLLAKLLRFLTLDELHKLIGKTVRARELVITKNGRLDYMTVVEILKLIEEEAEKDPFLKSIIIDITRRWAQKAKKAIHTYRVRSEDLEKFKKLISDKAKKTRDDYIRYLSKALRDLNWELNPDRIREYLIELKEEKREVAHKVSVALKKFIKEVIQDPILYNSFKTIQSKEELMKKPLTLTEVKAVAKNIEHIGAKAYFVLLAETGLRPGEVLNLTIDQIDLLDRMVKVLRAGESKRAYVSFFSKKTQEFFANVYLPFRAKFVKQYAPALRNLGYGEDYIKEWNRRLFPFRDYELRQEIYRASEKAIGRQISLYELRAFFASYMSLKGMPAQIIDIIQGRLPPKQFQVLAKHYLAISIRDLRDLYDRANLTILN